MNTDPAIVRDRQDTQPEPIPMFLVPTGEMASEGVPVYRAFETLAEANDFALRLHPIPTQIVEISLTPGRPA